MHYFWLYTRNINGFLDADPQEDHRFANYSIGPHIIWIDHHNRLRLETQGHLRIDEEIAISVETGFRDCVATALACRTQVSRCATFAYKTGTSESVSPFGQSIVAATMNRNILVWFHLSIK